MAAVWHSYRGRRLRHPGYGSSVDPVRMSSALAWRRRRRLLAAHRPQPSGLLRVAIVAIPVVLFSVVGLAGVATATVGLVGYTFFAKDLPEPRAALERLEFTQQSKVYDRSGKVQLALLGSDRREPVTFEEIPGELIDATTVIEDHSFWDNPGFDPAGFVAAAVDTINGNERGGSTITQQLVRKRLLPESAFADTVYERKIREIIQSIRLTEAYPGLDGKRAIIEAYLNNSFYGNRNYGVAAAARGYFDKDLSELTLAECALLAAIPQWPARFDLRANAVEETVTDDAGKDHLRLVVPPTAQVVQRRNYILERMKTFSVLTGSQYVEADYEAAKTDPVILAPPAANTWKAAHFVWQVRDELGQILCGTDGDGCPVIDTGGYRVITTLDWRMQKLTQKWVYAAAIIPNSKNPVARLRDRGIPRREWGWIRSLRGHNIHNAAAGVVDYRTGQVLAYAGSASYTAKESRRLQPRFDVLADGWRQPGSAIKPLVYVIGIDDRTMTAATMFMDVVTNFAQSGSRAWYPIQADRLERGPVRLRSALQFSLNIPAIKAGYLNGLKHQFRRMKDFGLTFPKGAIAVPSMSIGTIESHPIDMISAYGAIANGGVLVRRHTILRILDAEGRQVWPAEGAKPDKTRIVSKAAAYIVTDILAGNSNPRVNPFWGRWRVTNGVTGSTVRPAAYKTGTTSDNRDVHAYGYLAPPKDASRPALVVGVWMGNSDNSPNDGKLSLDTSAPLWSAIMSDVSKGMPIEGFGRVRPKGIVTRTVDAFTGTAPGSWTTRTVKELFLSGTGPKKATRATVTLDIDAATGLVWREGCAGPMVTRSYVDLSRFESSNKRWQRADVAWQARAAGGAGASGGPKGTRTAYFYGGGFYPFGATWGASFAPSRECPIAPVVEPCVPGTPGQPDRPCPPAEPTPKPGRTPKP